MLLFIIVSTDSTQAGQYAFSYPKKDLISDAQFFESLNLQREGLEAVRAAVEAGDFQQAKTNLVAYYRARKSPHFFVDPDKRPVMQSVYDKTFANQILKRTYNFYNYPSYQFKDKINWEMNPVGDVEWTFALNRHGEIASLARAWFFTNEERYAKAAVELLLWWISDSVNASTRANSLMWRTLDTAIRLITPWPTTWYLLRDCESFSTDARISVLKSIWHQTEFLMRSHGRDNWLLTESNALVTIGILFPEFRRSTEWEAEGWRRLTREIESQIYPDGSHIELTPHYQIACIDAFTGPVELSRLNDKPIPDDYLLRLKLMYKYLARISKPDFRIPMLNDSDHDDIRALARRANVLFRDDHFLFISSDGKEGASPGDASMAFPYAGQYVMRTDWSKQALYCVIDAGPYGTGHQHEDKLSLDIHAYGADLIVDPGRYSYSGDAFTTFFRSSYAHNLVLVDGNGQHRAGTSSTSWSAKESTPNTWHQETSFDYFRGAYSEGFGPQNNRAVKHERVVLFLKPDYWIVCDYLMPSDSKEHYYEWLWHFGPGMAEISNGTVTFQATNAGVIVATGFSFMPKPIVGNVAPVQGWVSYKYGKKEPAPMVSIPAKAVDPLVALTVIYPYPNQEAPAIGIEDTATDGNFVAAKVFHPKGTDLILFSSKSGDLHLWHGMQTDAEVSVIRLDATDHQRSSFLFGGTYLHYRDKTVASEKS